MIFGTPPIVTNGLLMHLDAGSRMSYTSGSTTWNDLSGNGNSGTLAVSGSNAISASFNNINQGSIRFNGTGSYVDCGNSSTLNFTTAFSVGFWVSSNITTSQYYVSRWTYSTGNFRQWAINSSIANEFLFRISSNGTDAGVTAISSSNTNYSSGWHYVCGTWGSSTLNLYVDGILVAGPRTTSTMVSTAGQKTFVGNGDTGVVDGWGLSGSIAQVQIYNRALSAQEVAQNYNALKSRFGLT